MKSDTESPQLATEGRYASSASGEPAPPPRRPRESASTLSAAAFGHGMDARHAGRPESANPYGGGRERREHDAWEAGWHEVNSRYAEVPKGRWTVRPLLEVSR